MPISRGGGGYGPPAAPQAEVVTALDWDGAGNVRRMLYWDNPFPIYGSVDGVTYLFKVYPREITRHASVAGDRHWTTFFWGNSDDDDTPPSTFTWDSGAFIANTYYGAHPYPTTPPNATTSKWEISVGSVDPLGADVTYDRWYTQAFRAWRQSSSITNHEFYYDLDLWTSSGGTQGMMSHQVNHAEWADTNPPIPRITMGQAAWLDLPSNEEANMRIRSIQFFDKLLTVQQCIDEHATPGSSGITAWYKNINPTASDVTDKSGSGHHGQWRGTTAATWTG